MKMVIKYISEIVFSVFLIFISYFVWDRIDVEAYERYITQFNSNDIIIDMENDFDDLGYLSDEKIKENAILHINNYQNKKFNTDILMVLSGANEKMLDDLYLIVNGENKKLTDIYVSTKDDNDYFLVSNINLDEYEKVSYELNLLIDDKYDFNEWTSFSYNFIEEIKG